MKLEQLRKIIREEVRTAVKEELQEVITEAVKIASNPSNDTNQYKPVTQKNIKQTWSTGKLNSGTIPLEEMLNQTKQSMTSEEYKNVYTGTSDMVQKPNFATSMASSMGMSSGGPMPGIDISNLNFVKKAGAIYNAAQGKDKNRLTNA